MVRSAVLDNKNVCIEAVLILVHIHVWVYPTASKTIHFLYIWKMALCQCRNDEGD